MKNEDNYLRYKCIKRGGDMEYTFKIQNLHCANCANKIQDRLNKEEGVKSVNLNFMLKTLTINMETSMNVNELARYISNIAEQIEKGVRFVSDEFVGVSEEATLEVLEDSRIQSSTKGREKKFNKEVLYLGASVIFMIAGAIMDISLLFIIAYIFVGYDVIVHAFKNFKNGRVLDENFLMTIATFAALAIGEYPEAVAVMLFYKVGEYMQEKAVNYSTKEIEKAMDIRPDFARVIRNGAKEVSPKEVHVNEIIEVRPGEKIPLDGVIIEGRTTLDTSMLTGESLPVYAETGVEVLSGSINKDGIIKVKVTKVFGESTVSKILDLIQNASNKKSKSEAFITKFAKWYTPVVVGLALFTAIVPSLITGNWIQWIYSSIVFLVISCPCALVVSVPLGFFAGIGAASKSGVLVKGSNYLETLSVIDTVVLDKTGTITKGQFGVTHVVEAGAKKEEILKVAALLEANSNHPIARSIVKAYGKEVAEVDKLVDYKEISGEGVSATLDSKLLLAGNAKLMERYSVSYNKIEEIGSHIYVAEDGKFLGALVVADEIKEDSASAIKALKARGIKQVIMLTGDKREVAEYVGNKVGVDAVYSELLPGDKVERVEALLKDHKVAFVGDGINDAPVLARADIGVAMGGVGSDAAIEAADVVLMTDKLTSIEDVMKIAAKTKQIVVQNIAFALGIKVIVLLLGLFGIANMWLAIFADVGVSLIAVMNSIRILGKNMGHMITMIKVK